MKPRTNKAIDAVAAFEAFKGVVVLLVASGVTLLAQENLHDMAVRWVAHAHLNPAAHYPQIFIQAAAQVQNAHLSLLALGAAGYVVLRFIEAYGLFRRAGWAEVLAAVSGAIYIPLEIASLLQGGSWLSLAALLVNLLIVGVMLAALWRRRRGASGLNRAG